MARRKKATRRRRKPALNLYDMAVAYGNLNIITQATLGSGPIEFVGGAYDIGWSKTEGTDSRGQQMLSVTGASQISLADVMNAPSMSFDAVMSNARSNAVPAALAAISFNIGASVFKKIMRKPFNQANKLIRPLGLNVRIG